MPMSMQKADKTCNTSANNNVHVLIMYNVKSWWLFLHDLTRESVAVRNFEKGVRGNEAVTSESIKEFFS